MAKVSADVIEVGRLSHKRGPATARDRSPAAVFDRGTNRRPELVERRCRLAVAVAVVCVRVFCIIRMFNCLYYFCYYITGSPAGLSRVNGVHLSCAKTWNVNPSPKSQFYFNQSEIRRECKL